MKDDDECRWRVLLDTLNDWWKLLQKNLIYKICWETIKNRSDARFQEWQEKALHGQFVQNQYRKSDWSKTLFVSTRGRVIPEDQNIVLKKQDKVDKYQYLRIEVQKSWHIKAKVIPVIIGALGTVSNNLEKHFNEIDTTKDIPPVEKRALLGTTYVEESAWHFRGRVNFKCQANYLKSRN